MEEEEKEGTEEEEMGEEASSFNPITCNLWDVVPSSCFPASYNLPYFKSKVDKLPLISSHPFSPLSFSFRCWGFA